MILGLGDRDEGARAGVAEDGLDVSRIEPGLMVGQPGGRGPQELKDSPVNAMVSSATVWKHL